MQQSSAAAAAAAVMDSEIIDADVKVTTTEGPPPPAVVDSEVSAGAAASACGGAAGAELGKNVNNEDDVVAASTAGGVGVGDREEGSGRLSSLVPTLGRFATRAHKASAPYLSYAAQASQEAARCVLLLFIPQWGCLLLQVKYRGYYCCSVYCCTYVQTRCSSLASIFILTTATALMSVLLIYVSLLG